MRLRTKLLLVTVLPFSIAFCTMYYLRITGNDKFLLSEQYFTSSYKGCFIPEQTSTENYKTVVKNAELYLYINPIKTGKIKVESVSKNTIKITYDEDQSQTIQVCPADVLARVSVYEIEPDYFEKGEGPTNSGRFVKTFEGEEAIELTIPEKKAAYIRMENFPSK
jgi:hypothetical protein